MGLIDSIVDRAFRDEKAGRVVVFAGGRRKCGYLVRTEADELKIRAFLKMFYFAHVSIVILGMTAANSWSIFVVDALWDRAARHVVIGMGIALGIYALVVGLPEFFLWRAYRKSALNFVSVKDEVVVSSARPPVWNAVTVFAALGALLILVIVMFLVRPG